jgi:uncharacterized coiled-coil protein SlyX
MTTTQAQDREDINELQVRIAFLEDTLSQLDQVVRELSDENRVMGRELKDLKAKVAAGGTVDGGSSSLEDEKPPHY